MCRSHKTTRPSSPQEAADNTTTLEVDRTSRVAYLKGFDTLLRLAGTSIITLLVQTCVPPAIKITLDLEELFLDSAQYIPLLYMCGNEDISLHVLLFV